MSNILGIFQSDLIIRSAIMAGLEEMRSKPYLLDFCFASLMKDLLTYQQYGRKEITAAKRWFLSTKIPVVFNKRVGEIDLPCISISLLKSAETRNTLSDTNYEKKEAFNPDNFQLDLTSPFTPVFYNRTTGVLVVPEATMEEVVFSTSYVVFTRRGNAYPVLEVIDDTTIVIAPNINEELNGSVIRSGMSSKVITMGSAIFSESYSIGVYVKGEPIHLVYLHSIVTFVLLRNRRTLLEGRGLERTYLDSGEFSGGRFFEGGPQEPTYARFIQLNGDVTQWWPESEDDRIANTQHLVTTLEDEPATIDGEEGLVFSTVEEDE